MLCSKCNQTIDDDSKFCVHCGQKIGIQQKSNRAYKFIIGALSLLLFLACFYIIGQNNTSSRNTSPQSEDTAKDSVSKEQTATNIPQNQTSSKAGASQEGQTVPTTSVSQGGQTAPGNAASGSSESKSEDLGYFKVTINGKEYSYKPSRPFTESADEWSVSLYTIPKKNQNCFHIDLPSDVKSGDTFYVDQDTSGGNFGVSYENNSGEFFGFGYPLGSSSEGKHLSSQATLTITKWEGMGGYATGTFSGQIKLTQNDVINFDKGEFKLQIKPTGF